MKRGKIWLLLAFISAMIAIALKMYQSMSGACAVGVIGGADGPTAIYVTRKNVPKRFLVMEKMISIWSFLSSLGLAFYHLARDKMKTTA